MRVIYVDDEQPALDTFASKVKGCPEIESLNLFSDGKEALRWVENNKTDTAFLDIEMSGMNGIELAKQIKKADSNIRIFFMTAYGQYALDAFGVKALGYIVKPYTKEEIMEALQTASLMRSRSKKKVVIRTIPSLTVWVDGKVLSINGKRAELFALLTDRAEAGVTAGEAISCLWPDRAADEKTKNLYRVTVHQLIEELKMAGIEDIIGSTGQKRYMITEMVECDLYSILDGKVEDLRNYGGCYLQEYSWAEARNGQLTSIKENIKTIKK